MNLEIIRSIDSMECICELTKELDHLSKIDERGYYDWYFHYINVDSNNLGNCVLPIRVPGGTVGGILINEKMVIRKIEIDTRYVVKTYPDNINELMEKYVGIKIRL